MRARRPTRPGRPPTYFPRDRAPGSQEPGSGGLARKPNVADVRPPKHFRSFPRRGVSHVRGATNLLHGLAVCRMWLPDRSTEQRSGARESTALSSGLRCFCWDVGLLIEEHVHEPSGPDEVPCALDTRSLRRARRRAVPRLFDGHGPCSRHVGQATARWAVLFSGPCRPRATAQEREPPRARKTMGAWDGGAGGSCGVCHQAGDRCAGSPCPGMVEIGSGRTLCLIAEPCSCWREKRRRSCLACAACELGTKIRCCPRLVDSCKIFEKTSFYI